MQNLHKFKEPSHMLNECILVNDKCNNCIYLFDLFTQLETLTKIQCVCLCASICILRYGQLSGMVEPVAGLLGAVAVVLAEPLLPFALAFAAGAMVYVVVDDIIPEAQVR